MKGFYIMTALAMGASGARNQAMRTVIDTTKIAVHGDTARVEAAWGKTYFVPTAHVLTVAGNRVDVSSMWAGAGTVEADRNAAIEADLAEADAAALRAFLASF